MPHQVDQPHPRQNGSHSSGANNVTAFIDYHLHTHHSFDCKIPMAEMCAAAIDAGISEIAFSDHFNNHLLDIDLGYYDPERYFTDIERCRMQFPNLTIRTAVEVGEPHRWQRKLQPVLERYPYDVVLGSLHWVGNNNMFNVDYFRGNPPQVAFGVYFTELARMAAHGGFNILAHVDLPKRVGFDIYGAFDIRPFEDTIRAAWRACIDNGIALELNTKGLRSAAAEIHPAQEALRWYVEMGGHLLTFGSDAHRADNIGSGFEVARQSALSVGLSRVCRFERGRVVGWSDL
jgi:histidinol-phosphatase (PHP family)